LEVTETGGQALCAQERAAYAIEDLVRQYSEPVKRFAYYHVRDRYLAEDIAQEVFCRVYRSLQKFRGDSAVSTWIYRITVNVCRDAVASAGFRRMLPWRGADFSAAEETRMFEEVEGGEVFRSVMELPKMYRTVISLYYFEDLATPGIAKALGISEEAVRARLCRGRTMLRKSLEGTFRE
jgi:RNA polymerase sigma-70 factor (ECF subfamily)